MIISVNSWLSHEEFQITNACIKLMDAKSTHNIVKFSISTENQLTTTWLQYFKHAIRKPFNSGFTFVSEFCS